MPQFSYRAVGRDGRQSSGVVEAEGPEFATRQLRAQGLTLLQLEAGAQGGDTTGGTGRGKAANRADILALTSELTVLLRSGLPLDRSLKVLVDMAVKPSVRQMLSDVLGAVKGGGSFSQALEPHSDLFGTFYLSMVRSGEVSGRLPQVLDRLVEYLATSKANRDSVVSSMMYPAILAVVSVLSVFVMLGVVVPQFESLFDDMGEGLPTLTLMIIGAADFVKSYGLLILGLIGLLIVWFRHWSRTPKGRVAIDKWLLNLPVVGGIIFKFEMSKFSRTVGTLLENGVSLLKSIAIAIDTVGNEVIRDSLGVLPPAVKAGERMHGALEETGQFTPMVIQMIRVGEESGRLDQMMLELSRVFEDHVQTGVKRGLVLLEPVMILGMGVIIGLIIIAILLGILSINDLAL